MISFLLAMFCAYRPSSASLEGPCGNACMVSGDSPHHAHGAYSPVARMTTLNGGAIALT